MVSFRHFNPVKIHLERITQPNKKLVNNLDYDGIEFPVWKKDFNKIETKSNICINMFCYKNKLVFPNYVSDQENSLDLLLDLLLVMNENMSHYMYMKDFDRFMFHKTKNTFVRVVYSVLVVKMYWQNIKKFVWALTVHSL